MTKRFDPATPDRASKCFTSKSYQLQRRFGSTSLQPLVSSIFDSTTRSKTTPPTTSSTPISSGIRSRRNNAVNAFKTTTPCSIFQCSRTPSANRLTREAETRQSNSFQHALVNQNVFVDSSCHFCSSPHAAQLHQIISSPSLCIMQSTYVHCF